MPKIEAPPVRVGQIWADNDKRGYGRTVRVVAIEPARPGDQRARAVPARAVVEPADRCGPRTRIRLDRFRPTANGYRLITDTPAR